MPSRAFVSGVAAVALMALPCPVFAAGPIVFRDKTAATGIDFRHTTGGSGRKYMAETVASGLATFDYDGDGRLDLYLLSGVPLEGAPSDPRAGSRLYRNVGDWQFADTTVAAGLDQRGYSLGVAVGDYDADGWPDVYTNDFGPNTLHRNNGDGTFTDVTAAAGVARGEALGAGANFLDIDGDGVLDLFVANYVDFRYDTHRTSLVAGRPDYARPREFAPRANRLFRGTGQGRFDDVSAAAGIAAHAGAGMGSVCFDADGDGRTDIFLCNDQRFDFLFHNEGDGSFRESALAAGVACNVLGAPTASMGVDAGDYDNDGRIDLVVTPYFNELPVLHHALGGGQFEDVAARAGLGVRAVAAVKWGVALVDLDNDGHRDIVITCGRIYEPAAGERSAWPPVLFRNLGNGRFANVSDQAGDLSACSGVARGLACDDLDGDGRVDLVILNRDGPATVLRNESPAANHWVGVRLRGKRAAADGTGARITVVAGDLVQVAEVHSGRGYQSHFGAWPHFGLGTHDRIDRIEVRWAGGTTDVVGDVPVDRLVTIVEGTGPTDTAGSTERGQP